LPAWAIGLLSRPQRALLLHGKEGLADFKVPAHIEFRESLPKSPAGKILRGQL
jgi:acyl-coenzyme A synthetase/AMP-(fatty) acid ligase